MQEITLNLNITIGVLTEESEERIISLVEKLSKTTKVKSKVQNINNKAQSKPKILNSEKNIAKSKQEVLERIQRKPNTIYASIMRSIFKRIRFTLHELHEEFPDANAATIRAYVNDLKKAGILHEMDRGKYFVLK